MVTNRKTFGFFEKSDLKKYFKKNKNKKIFFIYNFPTKSIPGFNVLSPGFQLAGQT